MTFTNEDHEPKKQEFFKLRTKPPSESRVRKTLAFSSDHDLREAYLSFHGSIRIGKILEDLDSMAGISAYKHAEGFHPENELTIVTAAVDRISLLRPIVPYWDLEFESNIIWTGRSSMLVRIDVTQPRPNGGPASSVMVALFSMVAREKYNNVAAEVHQLEPITEREKQLFHFGEEQTLLRKERRKERFEIAPPNDEERDLLHNMWLKENATPKKIGEIYKDFPSTNDSYSDYASMPSTRLTSTRIMMPQRRNIHNKIFGGYLLREAYELSWAVCYAHTKGNAPTWLSLDENMFVQPVEIGSLMSFSAEIVYSEKKNCVIRVDADVMHPHLNTVERTNVFHFTFQSSIPKQVIPHTYDESIRYLEGRRIAKKGKDIQQRMRVKEGREFA